MFEPDAGKKSSFCTMGTIDQTARAKTYNTKCTNQLSAAIATTPQSHLEGTCSISAGTTALPRPKVVAIPIEGHEKDVLTASIRVPVEGVRRSASHPGPAAGVHLRQPLTRCNMTQCQEAQESKHKQSQLKCVNQA